MTITFDDAVPEGARPGLTWLMERAPKAGIPVKSYRTRKYGVDPNKALDKHDMITYVFTTNDEGDIHVTVSQEC